tara:strand:+ start:117 stop:296 length:180 start_codon:yes stop_codon:yes gene_type:complete
MTSHTQLEAVVNGRTSIVRTAITASICGIAVVVLLFVVFGWFVVKVSYIPFVKSLRGFN